MTGMRPEDVYELTGVADPRLSPDGRWVAYAVWRLDRGTNERRGAIWVAPVGGSAPPRAVTSGAGDDGSPRWSPDGRWLAFTSKRGGSKDAKTQLFVMTADGPGEPMALVDDLDVEDPRWSPDGSRIAFVARTPHPDNDEKDERKRRPRRITRLRYRYDDEGWTYDRPRHLYVVDAEAEPGPGG